MAGLQQKSKCKKCAVRFSINTNVSTENFKEQNDIFEATESYEKVLYSIHKKYCAKKRDNPQQEGK